MVKMGISLKSLLVFSLVMMTIGCSVVQQGDGGTWLGFRESGMASYYDDKYQGRESASGELYRHELKTAAHRTLPFGSNVRVTNSDNSKSVVLRINDRGPFVKGRVIDLSQSAFMAIGNMSSGLIHVEIEVIP
jgi:rare lipoprotein A